MGRGYSVVTASACVISILIVALYVSDVLPPHLTESLWHAKQSVLLSLAGLFSAPLILALAATLLLEKVMPARPDEKVFSLALAQDFVWAIYEAVLHALVIVTFVAWLHQTYQAHLSFLTIDAIAVWPAWARFIVGALLLDFAFWLQHFLMHKIPWLWQLHTVHHSQETINFFTNKRYHVLEYIVRHLIVVVPFLVLNINAPTIIIYYLALDAYTNFYHGNIKTNLGPLKYILVTPQSHRVHHSKLPQHQDKNFGSIYTVWDFIFGTQYRGFSEYPATGIEDPAFPQVSRSRLALILVMPIVHMAYPFVVIGRRLSGLVMSRRLAPLSGSGPRSP